MIKPPSTRPLDDFLATFGQADTVRAEIKAYWADPKASPYPLAVYDHLMDARIAQHKVSAERGAVLKAYFAESFAPEPTTGYYPKHREPLIRDMLALYTETRPDAPLYRVEADIMNLGGLNRDLTAIDSKHKHLADSVIRLMATMLRERLEGCGNVCAIRHGGDELTLFVTPKDASMNIARINEVIVSAQHDIAQFVTSANLVDIAHTKNDPVTGVIKPPGVGIGCGVIRLHGQSDAAQSEELEAGVNASKEVFQDMLGPGVTHSHVPIDAAITELMKHDEYQRYRFAVLQGPGLLHEDMDYSGTTPEHARFQRIARAMDEAGAKSDAHDEAALLRGTHALTSKLDHVTGLPMFGDTRIDILPHFLQHYGDASNKATLVHFDYNNMGGGNKLGSWVGDAMGKVFAEGIERAMEVRGMEEFEPYLISQGGGKFALLLPHTTSAKDLDALHREVERQLHYRSQEALPLSAEQFEMTRTILKDLNNIYPNNRRNRHIFKTQGIITIGDIMNLKTRLEGADVACSYHTFDGADIYLGEQMEHREAEARTAHRVIGEFLERKLAKKRGNDESTEQKPTLPRNDMGTYSDKGTLKLNVSRKNYAAPTVQGERDHNGTLGKAADITR